MPVFDRAEGPLISSECGCCPVDRAASQCCCYTQVQVTRGNDIAHLGKRKACCEKESTSEDQPQPQQTAAHGPIVKFKFFGGILQQRCKGPLGSLGINSSLLAVCPEAPASMLLDSLGLEWLSISNDDFPIPIFDELTLPPRLPV